MNTLIYKKSGAIFEELFSKSWIQKLVEVFNSPVVEESPTAETEEIHTPPEE